MFCIEKVVVEALKKINVKSIVNVFIDGDRTNRQKSNHMTRQVSNEENI